MINRTRGEVRREYVPEKHMKNINSIPRAFNKEGKQIPTGVKGWTHTGFSKLDREDLGYNARKTLGDIMTNLFFENLFNESEVFFFYMLLNKCHKEIHPSSNILIKGGVVLSLFRNALHEAFKLKLKDGSVGEHCSIYIEETKPNVSDLDVIVPHPDKWANDAILDMGYQLYKKFNEYMSKDGLDKKLAKMFIDKINIFEKDDVLEHLMVAMKFKPDDVVDVDMFKLELNPSQSSYSRQLKDFYSESYKREDDEPSLLTCSCVEGVVMPTSKIAPLVFNLCKILLNLKITYGEEKSINIKMSLIDMSFQGHSVIGSGTATKMTVKTSIDEIGQMIAPGGVLPPQSQVVHTITINQAVNEDIRDMLYRRNNFIFEDTKYEKRLRRDIFYNTLLLYNKVGIKRTRRELKAFMKALEFIDICIMGSRRTGGSRKWLKCLAEESIKARDGLPSSVFTHILDSINSMATTLMLPKDEAPKYLEQVKDQYEEDLRTTLDRILIDVGFGLKLVTECEGLF